MGFLSAKPIPPLNPNGDPTRDHRRWSHMHGWGSQHFCACEVGTFLDSWVLLQSFCFLSIYTLKLSPTCDLEICQIQTIKALWCWEKVHLTNPGHRWRLWPPYNLTQKMIPLWHFVSGRDVCMTGTQNIAQGLGAMEEWLGLSIEVDVSNPCYLPYWLSLSPSPGPQDP